jgi:hypothetical protein
MVLGSAKVMNSTYLALPKGCAFLDQFGQGKAHPRNDHGPTFHATQTVYALFHGRELEQFFQRQQTGFFHQPFNLYRPRTGFQSMRVFSRVGFVGAEFVKIVVSAGTLVSGDVFRGLRTRHC